MQFTNSGLDAFVENGERPFVKYVLLINKAIYLERLDRISEAMSIVMDVWDSLSTMDEVDTVLGFYWLRSDLLRRNKQYEEAMETAIKGLDIARRNRQFNLLFDLWIVLGCTHADQGQFKRAEFCFEQALKLNVPEVDKAKFISVYTRLGNLYTKQERWTEAKDVFERAIQLGEEFNDAPRLEYALRSKGDFLNKQNDPKTAIQYYQQALDLTRKHALKREEYKVLLQLAECWHPLDKDKFQKYAISMYQLKMDLKDYTLTQRESEILLKLVDWQLIHHE